MKIVLAIDSFKGCLTSSEVEKTVEDAILDRDARIEVVPVPIADGGEGLLDALLHVMDGHRTEVEVHDPLMRTIRAEMGETAEGDTAVIEMAAASGLPLLTPEERHPMLTTSYGTGELMRHAIRKGCRHLLLGIGGSATNDGGMGMLQALGVVFYDRAGKVLPVGCGKLLEEVDHFSMEELNRLTEGVEVSVACDVDNPFYGSQGAAAVFGPQKGATMEEVEKLDRGLRHFAEVVRRSLGIEVQNIRGAGAAGGLGGALAAFLHAKLMPGVDLVLQKIDFEELVREADLMITGEGKADRQTLMGKVPAGVLRYGLRAQVPVVLMAGTVEDADELRQAGFDRVLEVTPRTMSLEEAMRPEVARDCLRKTVLNWDLKRYEEARTAREND